MNVLLNWGEGAGWRDRIIPECEPQRLVREQLLDLDRALELAKQAEQQRPEDPVVLDTLGWVHYKRGDLETAKTMLTSAVEKAPEHGALNYHLGQLLVDINQLVEAREKLEAAVADDKDFAGKDAAKRLLEKL